MWNTNKKTVIRPFNDDVLELFKDDMNLQSNFEVLVFSLKMNASALILTSLAWSTRAQTFGGAIS